MNAHPSASSFTRVTFLLSGALLIWALDFLICYAFAALACARGFADARVFGLPIVGAVVGFTTLLAAAAVSALLVRALHRDGDAVASMNTRGFIACVTVAVGVLALIAIVWNGFGAFVPASCPDRADSQALQGKACRACAHLRSITPQGTPAAQRTGPLTGAAAVGRWSRP